MDVDTAVKAARRAFKDPSWRDKSGTNRGNLLIRLSQLVEENAETLATIETWDNGKPYSIALNDDVGEVAAVFKYYGGMRIRSMDKSLMQALRSFRILSESQLVFAAKSFRKDLTPPSDKSPVSTRWLQIPPAYFFTNNARWNYPLAMAAWKLGPALACGNTVVIKAAEQTPLSILYLANLIKVAGFPPCVVNILNGEGRIAGAAIASHLGDDKIAFTGSTATGKEIMKMASVNTKNITLETGGKSPLLVFSDADLGQAVEWAHIGIMSNMGQVCSATSRILVQDGVYDEFVAAFTMRVKKVSKLGDPFDPSTFQGPQVTKAQYDRVLSYVRTGITEGATLEYGGKRFKGVGDGNGFFVAPAVFTNVTANMRIYKEEVFGPVVVIGKFGSEDEAVVMANDTAYRLGSAVFTQDIARAHRVARRVEAGMVWINSSNNSDFRVPFGGVKQSGIGRELGEGGLSAYSNLKAVHVNMKSRL